MTDSGAQHLEGSFIALFKQMGLVVIVSGFAICLALFGPTGPRVFVVSMAVLPVIALIAWFVSQTDRLTFDDRYECVRRKLRGPVEYSEIRHVRLSEFLGVVLAVAGTREGATEVLMVSLPAGRRKALRDALKQRCEEVKIKTVRYSAPKWLAVVLGIVVIGYAVGALLIKQRYPAANATCQPVFGDSAETGSRSISAGGVAVTIPDTFEAAVKDGGVSVTDSDTGLKIVLAPPDHGHMLGRSGRLFLAVSGIRGEYELFDYACCSSFGGVPLMLKAVVLSRWQDGRVLRWSAGNSRGILFGRLAGKVDARLLVSDRGTGEEVYGVLTSSRQIGVEDLHQTLRLITIARR